ncbi:MAG: hypothetical protein AAGA09_05075 [Pseudomonadota bacterium]
MYIDNQQDGENTPHPTKEKTGKKRNITGDPEDRGRFYTAPEKKERQGKEPEPLKKRMKCVGSTREKKRRNPMSHEHSYSNFGGFGAIVNMTAVVVTISLIGAGYFSALGSFAGVA